MPSDLNDMTNRMKQLEFAWPTPTPETEQRCLEVLAAYDALDVAEMLGLAS